MAIFMYAAKLAAFVQVLPVIAYMALSYLVKQTTSQQKIRSGLTSKDGH